MPEDKNLLSLLNVTAKSPKQWQNSTALKKWIPKIEGFMIWNVDRQQWTTFQVENCGMGGRWQGVPTGITDFHIR